MVTVTHYPNRVWTEALEHGHEWKGLGYYAGAKPANFPVPAIPLNVVFEGQEYMYDTMYIETLAVDDIDGAWVPDRIVCLWDWNWDRCMDWGTRHCEMQTFKY